MRICIRHECVIIGICANIFDKNNNLMPSCCDACEWACRFYKELWSHRQLTSSTEIGNKNLPVFLRKSHHFIFRVSAMVARASLLFPTSRIKLARVYRSCPSNATTFACHFPPPKSSDSGYWKTHLSNANQRPKLHVWHACFSLMCAWLHVGADFPLRRNVAQLSDGLSSPLHVHRPMFSWHVHLRLHVPACRCRFRWLTRTACLQNFQVYSHFQVHYYSTLNCTAGCRNFSSSSSFSALLELT